MAGSGARSRRQRTKTKHYTDDDPSTFTTKEKKGEKGVSIARTSTPSPIAAVVAKKRPRPKRTHAATIPRPNVSLSHHIRMLPLFSSKENQHSVINGRGLGIPPPLKKLEWTQIPSPLSFFPDETPRPASCTCLTSDSTYVAMGDTAGFLSIYTLYPKFLCVSRLITSASSRETQSELKLPQAKKFGLYQKKTHPNKIEKLALAGNRVVLATKDEIEMLDVKQNKILWSLPIDIPVHHLDIHPKTHQVLVSFSTDNRVEASSPLWILGKDTDTDIDIEKNIVTDTEGDKCDVNKTLVYPVSKDSGIKMSLGNRCAAIWDKSNYDHIMMVALIQNPDGSVDQELLCLDKNTFVVNRQAPVPNKPVGKSSSHTVEYLSQSPSGHLTLVSSTKGIRLIETSSFNLLRVFGDSVSLHGHSLLFQQCCFVRKPTLSTDEEDLLVARQNQNLVKDKDWMECNSAWILGVPFCNREPRELRDTLHLWDLWEGKHTYTTLMAPPKAEGFVSVEQKTDALVVTTQSGTCFTMSTTVKSDFPGIMYPPGYQVINDNLEYIEDEDDLDAVMTEITLDQEEDEDDDEDQIAEALRLSMMQAQEDVDVVSCDDPKPFVLPCHPEPFLKQLLKDGLSPMSVDPKEYIQNASFTSAVLLPMPHTRSAIVAKQEKPLEEPKPIISKAIRAKRSKAASLEAMLKSSLNPDLRRIMISRQLWVNGDGSRNVPFPGEIDVNGVAYHSGQENCSDKPSSVELNNPPIVTPSDESIVSRCLVAHSSGDNVDALAESKCHDAKNEGINNTVCLISGDARKDPNDTAALDSENSFHGSNGTDVEKGKLDAAAALLMSACGELDSPRLKGDEMAARVFDDFGVSKGIVKDSSTESPALTAAKPILKCRACCGRWVFHTCGKKAKPVDYEEIIKAEEERKEKEEEEKRKARAEKRRLADARRREARKKKKLEEEGRIRREEAVRVRWEQERMQEDLERTRLHSEDKDRRRADMLQRLQAEQASTVSTTTDWPQTVQSPAEGSAPYPQPYSGSQSDWPAPSHGFQTSHEVSRQPDWPQPAQTYRAPAELPRQTSKYSADWPPPPSQAVEQNHVSGSPTHASTGREWPNDAQTYGAETTNNSSFSAGALGRTGINESGHINRDQPLAQSTSTYASPAAVMGGSKVSETRYGSSFYSKSQAADSRESKVEVSRGQAQYPSSYYGSSTRQEAPEDSKNGNTTVHSQYPSSYYSATATSETIDPAQALASLAMFATAAPMASVSGDHPSSQSGYRQDSQHLQGSSTLSQQEAPIQGFKSNGWGNGEARRTASQQYENQI